MGESIRQIWVEVGTRGFTRVRQFSWNGGRQFYQPMLKYQFQGMELQDEILMLQVW